MARNSMSGSWLLPYPNSESLSKHLIPYIFSSFIIDNTGLSHRKLGIIFIPNSSANSRTAMVIYPSIQNPSWISDATTFPTDHSYHEYCLVIRLELKTENSRSMAFLGLITHDKHHSCFRLPRIFFTLRGMTSADSAQKSFRDLTALKVATDLKLLQENENFEDTHFSTRMPKRYQEWTDSHLFLWFDTFFVSFLLRGTELSW